MFRTHNERALSGYPGDPPDEYECGCHCHHPPGSCQYPNPADYCDCCRGIHDPDLCIIPDDLTHADRGGACYCEQTKEEWQAERRADLHYAKLLDDWEATL